MRTTKRTARAKKKPESPKMPKPKRKVGRPSKYDPSFCALVVELGRNGKSKAQMAAAIGIARSNMAIWEKEHPDFQDAIREAMDLSLAWWEDIGQEHMLRPGCNSAMFIFQMKNRFRDDYRDLQHQHGEHRITQTQQPQIASMSESETTKWIQKLLEEQGDGNDNRAKANGSAGALAHLT
jgi:hypothetical protein